MKRVVAIVLVAMLMLPGMAWAGSSTDAALGLGAFAALGTLLLGAAILSQPAIAAPAPVVVPPPPPPVVYAPAPPPVVYAPPPPPPVVYYPAPPVVYAPAAPVVVYKHPRKAYVPAPGYGYSYPGYARYGYGPHWNHR